MKTAVLSLILLFAFATITNAQERRSLADVSVDAILDETQVAPRGAGDHHVAQFSYMPLEFWKSIFTRDHSLTEAGKEEMIRAFSGIILVSVVQADISAFGTFNFYTEREVSEKMKVTFTDSSEENHELKMITEIDDDLQMVLSIFKPILSSGMGNLGDNTHFFVFDDNNSSSERLINPYEEGRINFSLKRRDDVVMDGSINTPLNSLFIPRICPNGEEAHVSWNFCPWSGEKLN